MQPIHELLARIRYDRDFGRGFFEIGYLDRHTAGIVRVAFQQIGFPEGERGVFTLEDGTGNWLRIPFHRVRDVYRDGQLIWHRGGRQK